MMEAQKNKGQYLVVNCIEQYISQVLSWSPGQDLMMILRKSSKFNSKRIVIMLICKTIAIKLVYVIEVTDFIHFYHELQFAVIC